MARCVPWQVGKRKVQGHEHTSIHAPPLEHGTAMGGGGTFPPESHAPPPRTPPLRFRHRASGPGRSCWQSIRAPTPICAPCLDSATWIPARVARAGAEYPNQLDYSGLARAAHSTLATHMINESIHAIPRTNSSWSDVGIHMDAIQISPHQPGIEPGPHRWQRCILPLDH